MSEETQPWIIDHGETDNPFIIRSDGTVEGTEFVRNNATKTVFPAASKLSLKVDAGKQVNRAVLQPVLAALEIKMTDTNGGVYIIRGDASIDPMTGKPYEFAGDATPYRDPLQGFDIEVIGPDGMSFPIHEFVLALTAGKALPFVEFHQGCVIPDIAVTDESGTYTLKGEGGQGFDCRMTGPDGKELEGVQWANFTQDYHGTALEFMQVEEAPSEQRSAITRKVVQPRMKSEAKMAAEAAELAAIEAVLKEHYGEPVTVLDAGV